MSLGSRGLLPPLMGMAPKNAVWMASNEAFRDGLLRWHGLTEPTSALVFAAGFMSGALEATVVTPFESVKVCGAPVCSRFGQRDSVCPDDMGLWPSRSAVGERRPGTGVSACAVFGGCPEGDGPSTGPSRGRCGRGPGLGGPQRDRGSGPFGGP